MCFENGFSDVVRGLCDFIVSGGVGEMLGGVDLAGASLAGLGLVGVDFTGVYIGGAFSS
jgi:hypothetical protein